MSILEAENDALKKQLEHLSQQVGLLTKAMPKDRWAAVQPEEQFGKHVFLNIYFDTKTMSKRVVKSWEMRKDFVRTTTKEGVIEEQTIRVFFFDDADFEQSEVSEGEKSSTKKSSTKNYIDMPYKDFYNGGLTREVAVVTSTQTDSQGVATFLDVEFDGKKYSVGINFVN